ncbi:MAG: DUF447 domain-containing protein [Planctomycetota bacterium]
MILESIILTSKVTRQQPMDVQWNVAPIGPIVIGGDLQRSAPEFVLRPWEGSTTCDYLKANPFATLHVTDDVRLIAAAAISHVDPAPLITPIAGLLQDNFAESHHIEFHRLHRCHRWFAVQIQPLGHDRNRFLADHSKLPGRYEYLAKTIASGTVDSFWGFNRAKHAVIEAAILATRLQMTSYSEIRSQLKSLETIVTKTGGRDEIDAFAEIKAHVQCCSSDLRDQAVTS